MRPVQLGETWVREGTSAANVAAMLEINDQDGRGRLQTVEDVRRFGAMSPGEQSGAIADATGQGGHLSTAQRDAIRRALGLE
jgi:hypothetical protein